MLKCLFAVKSAQAGRLSSALKMQEILHVISKKAFGFTRGQLSLMILCTNYVSFDQLVCLYIDLLAKDR